MYEKAKMEWISEKTWKDVLAIEVTADSVVKSNF